MNVDVLIERLIDYDSRPLTEAYSPLEYGELTGMKCSVEDAAEVVRHCWRRLPGTLAESFLEGFCTTAQIELLESVLLDCISTCHDVGGAAALVRFLLEKTAIDRDEVFHYLYDELEREQTSSAQDRLAYGMRAVCSSARTHIDALNSLVQRRDLTDYAKKCIHNCLAPKEAK